MSAAVPETSSYGRRTLAVALVAGATLLLAGCAPTDITKAPAPSLPSDAMVTNVVDSPNDAGRASSVAIGPDGNLVLSYLLLVPTLKPNELPPAVVPGAPQPPAVIVAESTKGVWIRTSVTPQKLQPFVGDAPAVATPEGKAKAGVDTSVAVAADGTEHVLWTTPSGVFYSSGKAGTFSPQEKVDRYGLGGTIAVASDGTPWIAYYQGASLRVASRAGGAWTIEDAVAITQCDHCPPVRAAIALVDDQPVVAFGDPGAGNAMLAVRQGTAWQPQTIEEAGGGFAMSLAADAQGALSVAYYTADGQVRHGTQSGGDQWAVDTVSDSAGANATADQQAGWGTGIGVDGQGTPWLTYTDTSASAVVLTSGGADGYETQNLPGARDGINPALAVSAKGGVAASWYDSFNSNMNVSSQGLGVPPLAFSPPPVVIPSAQPPTSGGPPPCEPDGTELQISAQGLEFDTDCLAAPAGEAFTLAFDNQAAGIPHNVAVYTDSAATQLLGGATGPGDFITGPATVTYDFDPLDAGQFYFRCDIHPTMQGTFVVA
jgi:plastocyanin